MPTEQTQQMQTLLEIKAELNKLSSLDYSLEQPLQILNHHADMLKSEIDTHINTLNTALRDINIRSKRLLSMHLYRSLAYQDIIKDRKSVV